MQSIYLDHAAFTPIESSAIDAMAAAAREFNGNPESMHHEGRRTNAAVNEALVAVGSYLGTDPTELTLFGSATEAFIAAIDVVMRYSPGLVATSDIEHPRLALAIRQHCPGQPISMLANVAGDFQRARCAEVLGGAQLVVLSACNHELGTAPDLLELMRAAPQAYWLVDAVQAAPWLDLRPLMHDRALIVIASSKLGGPPGMAALRVPSAIKRVLGPGWPRSTSSASWLVSIGFGAALRARNGAGQRSDALAKARVRSRVLLDGLQTIAPKLVHNAGSCWLGPIVNVSFPGVDALALEHALDLEGVAVSRTAACQQRLKTSSSVLHAAFPDQPWRASSSLRFSLGWNTSDAEIAEALVRAERILSKLTHGDISASETWELAPPASVPTVQEKEF